MNPAGSLTNGRYTLPQTARGVAKPGRLILADPPELGWVRASDNPTRKVSA
jgi:hypothetical protein